MRRYFAALAVLINVISSVVVVQADMYRYTDDSGSVCMTNKLDSVPKKFRKTMTVLKEELPAQQKMLPEVQKIDRDPAPYIAQGAKEDPAASSAPPIDNRAKYARTSLVLAGIIATYFLLTKVAGAVGFRRLGTVFFLGVVLLGGVYLYGLYVNEIGKVFDSLSNDAKNIKKNVESREQKTDQMLKKMPEAE